MHLTRAYEEAFRELGIQAAQVLLTLDDVRSLDRAQNQKTMLLKLLEVRGLAPSPWERARRISLYLNSLDLARADVLQQAC